MSFSEYFHSLFCCMVAKGKKSKKKATRTVLAQDLLTPPKTIVELRREKIKRMWSLKASCRYQRQRNMILGQIAFLFDNVVVVWCGGEYTPNKSTVNSLLHSFGDVSFIRDRWYDNEKYLTRLWRGAIIEYFRKKDAMLASLDIPVQQTCLRATMLETIIFQLADCELLHPLFHKIPSKVVISRGIPLRTGEISHLHDQLCTYGAMETFLVNNHISTLGVVCEVTYAFLTQAYLAMIMTDGQYFNGSILTATLEDTMKDKEILRDTKECMFLLSQSRFPK